MTSSRRAIQLLMLLVVVVLAARHLIYGIEKAAPIDGFCPFGGVVGFLTLISTGQFIQKIYWGSMVLMVITILMTIIFGRAFCGFICPLGSLQEWLRKIGIRLGIKNHYEFPKSADNYLRLLKYVVLILIMYFTYLTGELVFRTYDPYVALMHMGREFTEKIVGYSILGIVLLVALFTKNFWCRYLCPLGAFYGILSKLKIFKITRDEKTCTDCGICNKVCPHQIEVQHVKMVKDLDCVSCLECSDSCPENCLKPTVSGKTIGSSKKFGLSVTFVFLGMIGLFLVAGYWQTNQPVVIISDEGKIDVANIKGSNTLQFLLDETGIPLLVFQKELGVPQNADTSTMLRNFQSTYNLKDSNGSPIDTEAFRILVAKELGVSYGGKDGDSCLGVGA